MKRTLLYFVFLLSLVCHSKAQLTGNVVGANASCFGACNGSATVNIANGVPPFTYTWTPGTFTGSSASGLCAGIYYIYARDAMNAVGIFSVMIAQPPPINVAPSIQPQTCSGLGSASVQVTGGSGLFTYSWSPNGGTGFMASGLTSGNYTCTVNDLLGCGITVSMTVPFAGSPTSITITGPSTMCSQYTQTFTASGATNYTWTGGQTGPVYTNSYTALNNYMSTVTLQVTGYNGVAQCSATATKIFTVWQSPIIYASSNAFCETATGHSITVVGAQTYSITGNSWWVTPTVTTSYSITGTSAQGCVSYTPTITTLTVYPQFTLNVNQPTICPGQTPTWVVTGAPNYTVTGYPNNSYAILATDGFCWAQVIRYVYPYPSPTITAASGSICAGNNFTINPSGASTYSITGNSFTVTPSVTSTFAVTGTNSWGCPSATPALVTVSVVSHPTISVNSGTICQGSAFAIVPSGATSYSINGGNFTVSPNNTTTYTITGYNGNCVSNLPAYSTVTVEPRPTISINSGSICNGESFTLSPQGAFNYSITGSSNIVSPATNTIYYVIGTSSLNCPSLNTATASITVFNKPLISVAGPTAVCLGSPATWSASGAGTYSWSNNLTTNPLVFTPIFNTTYTVIGTSSQGCKDTAVKSLIVNNPPNVNAVAENILLCRGESTWIHANGAATYSITGGVTVSIPFSPVSSAIYTVTGIDANGCIDTMAVRIDVSDCTRLNQSEHEAGYAVYPNPNAGTFHIKGEGIQHIRILTTEGKLLKEYSNDTLDSVITLSCPKGIYFICIVSSSKEKWVRLVVE